jgi:hypothetical protein
MGFLDSIKKATGIGLTPTEAYERAYEKGVLLGPEKYDEAAEMFWTAAEKGEEGGDQTVAAKGKVNARLYGYISGGSTEHLRELGDLLGAVSEVEIIGSSTEMMPTETLIKEVRARVAEVDLEGVSEQDHAGRSAGHKAAAAAFKQFFNGDLITYKYQPAPSHNDSAQARFFYHSGMAAWNDALSVSNQSPTAAGEEMSKALNSFRQCQDDEWGSKCESWLERYRLKRTCWLCDREFQGAKLHFDDYSAQITPYAMDVLQKLGHDMSSVNPSGSVVLCRPCSSVVHGVADIIASQRAAEVRQELTASMEQMQSQLLGMISNLQSRVSSLETRMAFK